MDPIPTASATPEGGNPLSMKLDGIGLRVNVLRELTSLRPVQRQLITREELRERLLGLLEEDTEEYEETDALYLTLGMFDEEDSLYDIQLALLGEGVLGYYDPEEEKFYLVTQDQEFGPAEETVFAHEYAHGLQQQHFDIRSTHEAIEEAENSDRGFAFQALTEGDAYLADLLYVRDHMNPEEQAASDAEPSEELFQTFQAAPHIVQRSYIFPFQEGLFFAIGLYQRNGWEAVTAAFADPPVSTEQILHIERYLAGEQPVEVAIPDLAEALGEGWSELTQDTMGEFVLRSYLEMATPIEEAAAAAEGWGGDRLRLYRGPGGGLLLVHSIVWDTDPDAHEFFDTFLDFTTVRTGGKWASFEAGEAAGLMVRDDQTIFIELEEAATLLIFAPDGSTVEAVRAALSSEVSSP
jgi:hypothetical protein